MARIEQGCPYFDLEDRVQVNQPYKSTNEAISGHYLDNSLKRKFKNKKHYQQLSTE